MINRKDVIKGLEMHTNLKMDCGDCPYNEQHFCQYSLMKDALNILKEQTTVSTTWVCHLYRCGDKRFECSWCHGTSWKASDYCPDCGTRMAEVVNMDD